MYEVKISYVDNNINIFTASSDEVESMFENIDAEEYDNVKSISVTKI
jgi:hypothetical protein